jgi:hypothetical protein
LPVAAGLIIIQSLDSAALFSTHVAFLFNCVRADLCYIMVVRRANIQRQFYHQWELKFIFAANNYSVHSRM